MQSLCSLAGLLWQNCITWSCWQNSFGENIIFDLKKMCLRYSKWSYAMVESCCDHFFKPTYPPERYKCIGVEMVNLNPFRASLLKWEIVQTVLKPHCYCVHQRQMNYAAAQRLASILRNSKWGVNTRINMNGLCLYERNRNWTEIAFIPGTKFAFLVSCQRSSVICL